MFENWPPDLLQKNILRKGGGIFRLSRENDSFPFSWKFTYPDHRGSDSKPYNVVACGEKKKSNQFKIWLVLYWKIVHLVAGFNTSSKDHWSQSWSGRPVLPFIHSVQIWSQAAPGSSESLTEFQSRTADGKVKVQEQQQNVPTQCTVLFKQVCCMVFCCLCFGLVAGWVEGSIQHFLYRPRRHSPSGVPWRMVLERLSWHVIYKNHVSFHLLTVARRDSRGLLGKLILLCTQSLVLCSKLILLCTQSITIGLVLQADLALHPVIGLALQADLALHRHWSCAPSWSCSAPSHWSCAPSRRCEDVSSGTWSWRPLHR